MLYTVTGASACIQLKKFNEASAWCDSGLAVSFARILKYFNVNHHLTFFQRWICLFVSSFLEAPGVTQPPRKLSWTIWRRGGKRKESLQLRLRNLNICIKKVDAKLWLAEMTLVLTSLPLARVFQCLFTFALVWASRWLVEIWQLSRRGVPRELEVEFKFQRRSCKLSFLFPPAPESLLVG